MHSVFLKGEYKSGSVHSFCLLPNAKTGAFLTMEDTESTAGERTRGKEGNEKMDMIVIGSKPLHRFIRGEPRTLGIVVLIFGCAELLNGFELAKSQFENSSAIYIPFWQGALFLISGNLSIYTGVHPSKKMVTICLALYVVSLLGITVSVGYRIVYLIELSYHYQYSHHYLEEEWTYKRARFSSSCWSWHV
ncbi:membrane-spanning 4-domains subfamily A member 4A isoform 3-T3 [Polymixia lowei]